MTALPNIPIDKWPRDAVWLDGSWFPITGPQSYQNLALFSRKVTIGDHTKDSDDLISSWITLRDTTGGTGILDIAEGTNDARYWFGNLWTRDYGLLTLNRETVNVTGTYPLGDLKVSGTRTFYYAAGTDLYQWSETSAAGTDTTANLTSTPVNVGQRFQGTAASAKLFIPVGASGIDAWDGTTLTNIATDSASGTLTCLALARWDDKLISLGTDGSLWASLDGSSFVKQASKVDGAYEPRNLVVYFDRNGSRTLYIATDERLLAWDATNDVLVETEVDLPPHPDGGLGIDAWRGTLYQSAGMMVYFYNGGAMGEIGPTKNDGMPATFRGTVVDLRSEHNALYALVEGSEVQSTDTPDFTSETIFDGDLLVTPSSAASSVWAYTNLGWHVAWVGDSSATEPTRLVISAAEDTLRVWWGAGGTLHTQILPKDFHNPLAGLQAGVDRFTTSGYVETGWFDAAMAGFRKLASHLEIGVKRAGSRQSIQVSYAVDYNDAWVPLGDPITSAGSHVLSFNEVTQPDGSTFSEGLAFDRIRFRVDMTTDDPTDAPVVSFVGLYFIKIPRESGSWTFTVPCFAEGGFMGGEYGFASGLEIKQALDALLEDEKFIQFGYLGTIKRVKIAGVPSGQDDTGTNFGEGVRVVNIVEVRLPPTRTAV